ncbi:MAG TPA: hypothetical protein PKZ12_05345 [Smithellaceae bacterium]|nr:hypothetical protein [Smithellaceae bacterium]
MNLYFAKLKIDRQSREVFTIAFVLFFLETLYFKTSLFILDYLNALLIISYVLLGLGIGAIISHRIKSLTENMIIGLKLLIILFIILSFLNFILLPDYLFFSPILIIPFALGNIIIANYLKADDARKIYFFDLAGATAGVLFTLFLIPLFREENCFIIMIMIMCFSLQSREYNNRAAFNAGYTIMFFCATLLLYNLIYNDWLNFAKITRCAPGFYDKKIFCLGDDVQPAYSKGSNVQRIDAFTIRNDDLKNLFLKIPYYHKYPEYLPPNADWIYVAFDGQVNDSIINTPYNYYYHDPRIIRGLFVDPEYLLIGASAQGVVKSAYATSGSGRITGVELNPQIINLMQKKRTFYSGIYPLMNELENINGRTYLDLLPKTKKFDIITMMNIHTINDVSRVGAPEGLHTYEAINSMLDHLSERGFITIEERLFNEQGKLGSLKILNTIMQVMKDRGFKNPEEHIFYYNWICELMSLKVYGSKEMSQVVIKQTPFMKSDWEKINSWRFDVENYFGIKGIYKVIPIYPENVAKTPYAEKVHAVIKGDADLPGVDLSVITDDKPFPWSVYADNSLVKSPLIKIGLICLVLLLIISIYWLRINPVVNKTDFAAQSLYFGLIGLGYFIIEIGLINFYQILTGSPAYAFIFVLATLLFSSGIGSYYSRKFTRKIALLACGGILVFCLYHLFLNRNFIGNIGGSPLNNSLLVSLTILPLGFCMGVPFPFMLEKIKGGISGGHIPFFFAVNCLFATFAVILSFYLSAACGLAFTFAVGIICYAASFLLLWKDIDNRAR